MNFSTDLPKSKPLVTYIVASTMKPSDPVLSRSKESQCFRMHAVVLKNKRTSQATVERQADLNNGKGLILCHVRQMEAEESAVAECKDVSSFREESPVKAEAEKKPQPAPRLKKDILLVENSNHPGKFTKSKRLMEMIRSGRSLSYAEMYKQILREDEGK